MKRLFLITLTVLMLAGIGVVAWTVAGLPPVRMVWHYGFSYGPEPTGRTLTVESIEFVEIGPGCFLMGSEENAEGGDLLGRWCARFGLPWGDQPKPSNEMPVHWVEFPRGFFIAETRVTNAQHAAFDPKHERSEYTPMDSNPVTDVSWEDAKNYCSWLSERSGQAIRLPSESEWECACRAGSNRGSCFGSDANSDHNAHGVGGRHTNAWGLHEFHTLLWGWCEDTYHENYENAPADGTPWTEGGVERKPGSPHRVRRGGCFYYGDANCRSAERDRSIPGFRWQYLGFRPAFSSEGRSPPSDGGEQDRPA